MPISCLKLLFICHPSSMTENYIDAYFIHSRLSNLMRLLILNFWWDQIILLSGLIWLLKKFWFFCVFYKFWWSLHTTETILLNLSINWQMLNCLFSFYLGCCANDNFWRGINSFIYFQSIKMSWLIENEWINLYPAKNYHCHSNQDKKKINNLTFANWCWDWEELSQLYETTNQNLKNTQKNQNYLNNHVKNYKLLALEK